MRVIIIGAVAAGTSAAAKARRNSEDIEIAIYDKDSFISYSGCGMPYYIGGEVENINELIPRDPEFFKKKYNVDIFIQHEVLSINTLEKKLEIKNLTTGNMIEDHYDKLIIATGAASMVLPISGADNINVFTLRNITDMNHIKSYISQNQPKTAAIIGTGFIGLEVCENLKNMGIEVTLIEKLPQVTPGLDSDMALYVRDCLVKNGVRVILEASISNITEEGVSLSNGEFINAQMVLIAAGVKPVTDLAKKAGVELGITGAIKTDQKMETNLKDIYACGDCVEQFHIVTEKPVYRPLGSTANKTGRIAGDQVTGGKLTFRGILGTGIFKIFQMTVAQTGLTEKEARANGYDIVICHNIKPNKPEYMGGKEMVIKAVADKKDGRLLGVQIIGYEGVDKRIDVFVTAITYKAKVEDLFHLDLAYAPPFSTTKDPVMYTGMILDNAISGGRPLITATELGLLMESDESYTLIDVRTKEQYEKGHIENAINIPHKKIRETAAELNKEIKVITYCNKGVTGNAAQNILINYGFEHVFNLSGGYKQFTKIKGENLK